MIEVSMGEIAFNILRSLFLGLVIGALWDVVRIARAVIGVSDYGASDMFRKYYDKGLCNIFRGTKKKTFSVIFIALTDILFFFVISVLFVLFLYRFNYGVFRWMFFISALIGSWAYYHSMGRCVIHCACALTDIIRFIVNVFCFTLRFPFICLYRFLKMIYSYTLEKCVVKIKSRIDKSRMRRYTLKCTDRLSDLISFEGSDLE